MVTRRGVLSASSAVVLAGARRRRASAADATPEAGGPVILMPVELSEWKIEPRQSVFRVGQEYRFEVTNNGKLVHEWVIEPADAEDQPLERPGAEGQEPAVSELEEIATGAAKALNWTFESPGAYKMVCHIEGHAEAGMNLPFSIVAEAQVVEVTASDFALVLGAKTVRAGAPVAFVVHNHGKVNHEFVLEPKGAEDEPLMDGELAGEIEDIKPGTVRELIWTFAEPADIQTTCHVEGHLEAGMISYLTVTA